MIKSIALVVFITINLLPCLAQNPIWSSTLSGTRSMSIKMDFDGNYVVVGNNGGQSSSTAVINKMDTAGVILWTKYVSKNDIGESYNAVTAAEIVVDRVDSNYVLLGTMSYQDYTFLMKIDRLGNIMWYEKFYTINARSLIQDSDDNFVIIGNSLGVNYNTAVLKLNNQGQQIWFNNYNGSGHDNVNRIIQLPSHEYIVVGTASTWNYLYPLGTTANSRILKIDTAGVLLLSKTYDICSGCGDEFLDVEISYDGNLMVLGSTGGNSSTANLVSPLLMKFDLQLDTIWGARMPYGSSSTVGELGESRAIIRTEIDSSYMIVGDWGGKFGYTVLNSVGVIVCEDKFNSGIAGHAPHPGLRLLKDGNSYVSVGGVVNHHSSSESFYVVKFNSCQLPVGIDEKESSNKDGLLHPNPVSENLFIQSFGTVQSYEVYSVSGQQVTKFTKMMNESIDVSKLTKGVYILRFVADDSVFVKKFIKH